MPANSSYSSALTKIDFPKLKGTVNYDIWSMRIQNILSSYNCEEAIIDDSVETEINKTAIEWLRATVEDGPLILIRFKNTAKAIWDTLKKAYSPRGFNGEYLLCKEFLELSLIKFSTMEEYLTRLVQLNDQLTVKKLQLPLSFVYAKILNNLPPEYEAFIASITQSFKDSEKTGLDDLISNILDESRRHESKESVMHINHNYRGKKPYKITKGRFCRYCKLTSHEASNCYFLHPEKAPKSWKTNIPESTPEKGYEKSPLNIRDDNIMALYTNTQNIPLFGRIPNRGKEDQDIAMEGSILDISVEDFEAIEKGQEKVFITHKKPQLKDINTNNYNIGLKSMYIGPIESNNFILDNAATKHVFCKKESFTAMRPCDKTVSWGKAKTIKIKGIGNIEIIFKDTNTRYILYDVLYMPELGINLISQGQLDFTILSTNKGAIMYKNNKKITSSIKIQGLYYLPIKIYKKPSERILHIKESNNKFNKLQLLWHQRFGHINDNILQYLMKNTEGFNTTNIENLNIDRTTDYCEICFKAFFKNQINHNINNIPLEYLSKIASDLCGPIRPYTYEGYKYIITYLDKGTRYLEIDLLKTKDEVYISFNNFVNKTENQNNKRIKIWATDNGKEFINKRILELTTKKGIIHQKSAPYTKEQNGFIERINQTLFIKIRSLLYTANLPFEFWGDAAQYATYLYNRTPHSALNFKTPYETKNKEKPNIENIRTFGSLVFYKNKPIESKLDIRAKKGILLGLGKNQAYIYSIEDKKKLWSRDIKILENRFYNFKEINNTDDFEYTENLLNINNINNTNNDINNINTNNNIHNNNIHNNNTNNIINNNTDSETDTIDDNSIALIPSPQTLDYTDDSSIDELALIALSTNNDIIIPKNYKQAIESPNKEKWQQAMDTEYNELIGQNTWVLTDLPKGREALDGRWVYTTKTDNYNNIIKYKARYVVKGFNQTLGIDYLDTFSTTCRPESYRILFIITIYMGWPILQYDVKNAFVHAYIDTDIYIKQPIGYNINNNKVCKLIKALYGLKQAPRLWYLFLAKELKELGFNISPYDEALFLHAEYSIILIAHVDDILLSGPDINKINIIINKLEKIIKIQYIGEIQQFLGMNIKIENKTIYIDQKKYILNILERFNKLNLLPVSTPVDLGVQIKKYDQQATKEEINLYQKQVGALLYLSIRTRPDIAYAVSKASRYTQNPGPIHFKALDRIWKYLLYTIDLVLIYNCINLRLIGYCDADWAGCYDSRKSTTGYIFTLSNNIISWNSILQKTVALSSCEAEYMGLKEAVKEAIYLNATYIYIINNLNLNKYINNPTNIPTILTDSESARKLSENPEYHKRSKHIDIQYHFIRDNIRNKKVQIIYINNKEQLADGFTKGLNTIKHKAFIEQLKLKRHN
jgi:hypothetical protein